MYVNELIIIEKVVRYDLIKLNLYIQSNPDKADLQGTGKSVRLIRD